MKTKQLFFCSLTGLALLTTSCSSNDEALNGGNGASNDGNTYAQIAISVAKFVLQNHSHVLPASIRYTSWPTTRTAKAH